MDIRNMCGDAYFRLSYLQPDRNPRCPALNIHPNRDADGNAQPDTDCDADTHADRYAESESLPAVIAAQSVISWLEALRRFQPSVP